VLPHAALNQVKPPLGEKKRAHSRRAKPACSCTAEPNPESNVCLLLKATGQSSLASQNSFCCNGLGNLLKHGLDVRQNALRIRRTDVFVDRSASLPQCLWRVTNKKSLVNQA
jgi:hypothetical protein